MICLILLNNNLNGFSKVKFDFWRGRIKPQNLQISPEILFAKIKYLPYLKRWIFKVFARYLPNTSFILLPLFVIFSCLIARFFGQSEWLSSWLFSISFHNSKLFPDLPLRYFIFYMNCCLSCKRSRTCISNYILFDSFGNFWAISS